MASMRPRHIAMGRLAWRSPASRRADAVTFQGPTSSQPLALDAAGDTVAVVSPDSA